MSSSKQIVERLLEGTGIKINGPDQWDMKINNPKVYSRILGGGTVGLGEAFMEGWWDCEALEDFFFRILKHNINKKLPFEFNTFFHVVKAYLFNRQTKDRSKEVAIKHYDIGNDLYQRMLDKRMIYSCANWNTATSLDEAQENKLDLICRKLKLESGMRLLDIGCGWGGLAKYAAENYKVSVVGITLSREQETLARSITKGLAVEIRLQDYRELHEKFDRIVSVGMFEHVGYKNYKNFFNTVRENLIDEGVFLLRTIGSNETVITTDPWINKYIFPNSMLPSITQIAKSINEKFIVEEWDNFGVYYGITCMEWLARFESSWPDLKEKYNSTFHRMWKYYLCVSSASFRSRKNNLWQIVLTKPERSEGYNSNPRHSLVYN